AVAARTKLFHRPWLTKQAGNPGKRLEMIGARGFGRQEEHDNVDRFLVDGVEFNGLVEACEDTNGLTQIWKFAVRNCDAGPNAGRAQPLTLDKCVEDLKAAQRREFRRTLGEHLKCLLLIGGFEGRNDAIRRYEVA